MRFIGASDAASNAGSVKAEPELYREKDHSERA
jgi:hypothetical protein